MVIETSILIILFLSSFLCYYFALANNKNMMIKMICYFGGICFSVMIVFQTVYVLSRYADKLSKFF